MRPRAKVAAIGLASAVAILLLLFKPWELSIVEVRFADADDHSGVEKAIETGWLPEWFPEGAYDIRGAQRTFDDSFIWITFKLSGNPVAPEFLSKNCERTEAMLAKIPDSEFIQHFPRYVRTTYEELRGESTRATYYACPGDRREYFVATDGKRERYHLWAY